MIVDVRTYTLIPRKQAKYLELFEKRALPVTKRHGLELMSYYVSYIGALNQVVHLWGYENLADMEKKRVTPTRLGANSCHSLKECFWCRKTRLCAVENELTCRRIWTTTTIHIFAGTLPLQRERQQAVPATKKI